jgi:hypothetical protein
MNLDLYTKIYPVCIDELRAQWQAATDLYPSAGTLTTKRVPARG